MQPKEGSNRMFQPIEDDVLKEAVNALGRSINIVSTYGTEHPVFKQSISAAMASMQALLVDRKNIHIGAFNGVMTIDEVAVHAVGTLQKSLERHLVRLRITDLRLTKGISQSELTKLAELLAGNEAEQFEAGLKASDLSHIASEATRYQALQEGQTVANESELAGAAGNGILVLEDELSAGGSAGAGSAEASVHVDQIVAFLQGDLEADEPQVAEELSDLASDPDRLGQLIMESVAIRQSASPLSGESLSDVILGCLRRTFDGLRKQPAFQTTEGTADLQKALLLLEESMLDKIRAIAGEPDTELDRQIVQAIREMDENLGFELAARQYMEYRDALDANRDLLKGYVQHHGAGAAEELLSRTGFPSSDWKQIVVESSEKAEKRSSPPIAAELSSLTMILEKLEHLIKADAIDTGQMEVLLGQANSNLSSTTDSAKEKLETLSQQLCVIDEDDTGTIDGNAREMNRKELLSSIAEIAQELMQPLTAIKAAHEMLLNGYAGEITPEQHSLLSLASSSGDDLNYLMKELIKIVGIPVNRGVDERFAVPSKAA